MRDDISRAIIAKTSERFQNDANNSRPQLSLVVARKETLLDDFDFVERRRIRRTDKKTVLDVGIAVSHPRLNRSDEEAFVVYLRSGKVYCRYSKIIAQTSDSDWETFDLNAPSALKCDVAFPATAETNARGETEYVTSKLPFVFYRTADSIKSIDLATMETSTVVSDMVADISARITPLGLTLFWLKGNSFYYKVYSDDSWGETVAVNKNLSGTIQGISSFTTLNGFGIQACTETKLHRLVCTVSGGSLTWGDWDDALVALTATGTGAFLEYYDGKREAIYDSTGLTYCLENNNWFPSGVTKIYSKSYYMLEFDHTNQGAVYFSAVLHGKHNDIVYFWRYMYKMDVSNFTASVTKVLQVDNPITQINAELKNIEDSLYASSATLFSPSSIMKLGVRYGDSSVVDLGFGYIDQATFAYGGTTVSLSGRNRTGVFLNDQTFEEDLEIAETPSIAVETILTKFGLEDHYECDTSADVVGGNANIITMKIEAKTTGMQALEALNDIMTDEADGKQWKFEELPDGTIIVGYDAFRSTYNPKGNYIFDGWRDVFAISVDRCIDGVYSKVRVTGTTTKGKEIGYTYPVKNFRYWDVDENRIYYAEHLEGVSKSALKKYAKALAKQLKYIGKVTTYRMNLKPQLVIGDVARITYGEDDDDTKKIGAITEITHTMGDGGYFTEFTATSGGNVTEVSVPTPTRSGNGNNSTIVYTADKSAKGTSRKRRLNDFLGGNGSGVGVAASMTIIQGDSVNLPELIRNLGMRLLDEPKSVHIQYDDEENEVNIKWEDPDDLTDFAPIPLEWAGTAIVRNENGAPLHIWDGTLIADITVRDSYKNTWFVDDNNIKRSNLYFYGIFPYHIALDDADHPIKHYRYTKVVQITTGQDLVPATITGLEVDEMDVTVSFTIPTLPNGSYSSITLVAKKNGTPLAADDGDEIITLTDSQTSVEISGLDWDSRYYFVIFTEDDQGNTASSDPVDVRIGEAAKFILIDSYTNYHNPMVDLSNTGFKDGNQTTRWQYLQDGTFESYDNTQAQTKCVFSAKMKKGTATKLCIECTTENIAAYPDFGFGLLSSMPTAWGYPSGGNRGTVLKWLYDFASTTKGTYELSLDDISADTEFYLCFYNNSTENIVYKVWFEGIPEYTQYNEWWLQPSGDTQVPIKVYGTNTPLVLTINEIMTDLQAAGYNSVLFYPESTTGNYIMCAFSIANPTDSLYLSGKSVSIYDENTTYITSWSASGAPDSQNPKHFDNCYRYYISGGVRRLDRAGVTHNATALFNADPYVATDTENKEGGYPRIYYTSVQINHLYVDGKEIYQG